MKCPTCDGRGKTTEYDGLRKFWCDYKCEMCNGTGEVMTGQEYLQTCNTEQLAEWIYHERYVWSDGWYEQNGFTVNDVVDFLNNHIKGDKIMACKQSERCDHADICRYAKSDAYNILGGSCYRPKEPQTNEEWFCGLSTEEKAEFLNLIIRVGPYENEPNDFWEHVYGRGGEYGAKSIVTWLKQPHTPKE